MKCDTSKSAPASGAVYGIGFIGAVIYFIVKARGFWEVVLGVLKSFVWPAIMVYELFKYIGA